MVAVFLNALPEELIDEICSFLSKDDLHSIRLTCDSLRKRSYYQFILRHFHTSRFMFTQMSLQKLLDFAKDPKIGPAVKEVQLCLVYFCSEAIGSVDYPKAMLEHEHAERDRSELIAKISLTSSTDEGIAQPTLDQQLSSSRRKARRPFRRAYGRTQSSQNTLRTKGIDVYLLTQALRLLPNLESISLVSMNELKEGLEEGDILWGQRELVGDIGSLPVVPRSWVSRVTNYARSDALFFAHNTAVILGAIHKSGIKLKGSLSLSEAGHTLMLPKTLQSRKRFPTATPASTFADSQIEELGVGLMSLTGLNITHKEQFSRYEQALEEQWTDDIPFHWLMRLFRLMPSLRSIKINARNVGLRAPFFRAWADEHHLLPQLRRLHLHSHNFAMPDVIRIMHQHQTTLQEIVIGNCLPVEGDYMDLLRSLDGLGAINSLRLFRNGYINLDEAESHQWSPVLCGLDTRIYTVEEKDATAFQWKVAEDLSRMKVATQNR